jgi:hypothetical protein
MQGIEYDDLDKDFLSNERKIRKNEKEDILDETFKKAEISKVIRSNAGKKVKKKPFLKLGIILLVIAIIAIIIINSLPWLFIKGDLRYGEIQEFYYKNFENKEGHYFNEIDYIFESPCVNCSNYSSNYIGLTKNDFTTIPNSAIITFYVLALLGIIFTIFEIIEKWRNLDSCLVILIHSTFAIASDVIGLYVAYLCIKFLGSYFLLFYNTLFIEASGISNIVVIYPVITILLIISFTIIMIATVVMHINFHEFGKRLKSESTRSVLNTFKFGRNV